MWRHVNDGERGGGSAVITEVEAVVTGVERAVTKAEVVESWQRCQWQCLQGSGCDGANRIDKLRRWSWDRNDSKSRGKALRAKTTALSVVRKVRMAGSTALTAFEGAVSTAKVAADYVAAVSRV